MFDFVGTIYDRNCIIIKLTDFHHFNLHDWDALEELMESNDKDIVMFRKNLTKEQLDFMKVFCCRNDVILLKQNCDFYDFATKNEDYNLYTLLASYRDYIVEFMDTIVYKLNKINPSGKLLEFSNYLINLIKTIRDKFNELISNILLDDSLKDSNVKEMSKKIRIFFNKIKVLKLQSYVTL